MVINVFLTGLVLCVITMIKGLKDLQDEYKMPETACLTTKLHS
jgi:hypothetical protein